MSARLCPHLIRDFQVALATPRKLPSAERLPGRIVILDIAFANGHWKGVDKTSTHRLIRHLGPRLVAYVDHHDSQHHVEFSEDERFLLAKKAEHGACPEMITAAFVQAVGAVDTILCHDDFDGLASAAKWLNGGREVYEGCDHDAWCVDTRLETPSPAALRIERGLRGRPKDDTFKWLVIEHLLDGLEGPDSETRWRLIDEAAEITHRREAGSAMIAEGYRRLTDNLVFVDVTYADYPFDRTHLLLLGQERATVSAMRSGDNVTFAAPFDSGLNFLSLFGLSGGMPTVVTLKIKMLPKALKRLEVPTQKIHELLDDLDLKFDL